MRKKIKLSAIGIIFLLIAAAVAVFIRGGISEDKSKNLALRKGVKATSDSVETEELSADKAIDGDDETLSSRWSSENNWEDASHYIELEFPEEISVSFVVLKWERTNVTSYQLEGSQDGKSWEALAAFDQSPAHRRQEIVLPEAAAVKFLRLSTNAVSQNEEDYSNLYQNVSLYEFEVYADKPAAYYVTEPMVETRGDGSRYLRMPESPDGYQLTYLGADYEQVIGADCEVYENIQDKEVTVGFRIESIDDSKDEGYSEEISFNVIVPAYSRSAGEVDAAEKSKEAGKDNAAQKDNNIEKVDADSGKNGESETDTSVKSLEARENDAPQIIPAIAEWSGASGVFEPDKHSRIIIGDESLMQTAELFAARYREVMGYELPVNVGSSDDLEAGDFYLSYEASGAVYGVGEEGYVCNISDTCVINGTHERGIYWGTITVLQILKTRQGLMPQGIIRDYPKYEVRGFGIDVARKPVSMAMLYQIAENMSWYKMNDLSIHLNDNVILSTSGLTASFDEAMTAYSAFRLDTSVINDKGEKLTSEDYSYTAKEFADFIAAAKMYGVRVVPEIDTPAHSLSITKLFPEYALRVSNEAVDQIDLSKKKATSLVKDIWREALHGGQASDYRAAFDGVEAVNIGMDEYYGDGEAYRRYMNEIIELVHDEGGVETVRLWGSLGNMDGHTLPSADGLQMNIWSDIWADPVKMYEDGYSIINMQSNHLYIIAGGGYDYLDAEELYENWEPNKFYDYSKLETVPSYSPKLLGAAYMIWNDMSGSLDIGISEADLFERFFAPLAVISGKLWGEAKDCGISYEEYGQLFESLGCAPGSNPYALKEWEGDVLQLMGKGESDYVETGYTGGNGNGFGIGGSYSVSFDVYRSSVGIADGKLPEEQILFETDSAYAKTAFKAVQADSGKVGFSREGRDYSFEYTLPEEEWVTLTVRGEPNRTSLYVDGELVDTLGDAEPFSEYATFVFPLERIGSRTNSFCGMIKNIEVSVR